jgi:subtilase family serine protease
VDVTRLAYTGRYTLAIEGYQSNTQNASYSFNVVPVLPQAPVALSIGLQPAPNLQVQSLQASGADGSVHSGGTLNISWQTINSGDLVLDTAFQERVIVTNAQGQTVVNALLAYHPAVAGVIGIGQAKARSTQVLLPPGAAGAGQLTITIITDTSNAVLEKSQAGESDNQLQTTVESTLQVYPDLGVTQLGITPATGLAAGDQVAVSWRDENRGDATPANGWVDRVVVRNLSTGAVVLDLRVAVPAGSAAIAAGGALARQCVFSWPAGVNGIGNFEVSITADADGAVAEYNAADTAESNNTASMQFTSAPDLTIDGLTVLTTTPVSGGLIDLQWTVRNQGNAPTPTGWFDHIIVTNVDTGSTLLNLDVFYTPTSALAVGGSATRNFQLRLPDGQASVGNIRFTVVADQNASNASSLAETNEGNNQAQATRAAVLSQAANLVVTDFTAPATQRSGDAADFSWTVRNSGNATTPGTAWHDRIVLSADAIIGNADDVTVATVAHSDALAPGASYTTNWSATVPAGYDGDYRFALVTDVFNTVAEPDAEKDNLSALRAALLTPYHADLTVSELSLPASGNGGQSLTVSWRTTNQGDAATSSTWWYDRLWLSPTGSISEGSGAILLGDFARAEEPWARAPAASSSSRSRCPTA